MKKRIGRGVLALGLVLLIAGSAAAETATKLRVALFTPSGSHPDKMVMRPYLEKAAEESEGTLNYEIFAGGTLGRNPAEQLTLVQTGVADMAFIPLSYIPGTFDDYGITEIPLVENSRKSSAGLWTAFEAGLLPVPQGVHVLSLHVTGQNTLHLIDKADSILDVKGRKLRAGGRVIGSVASAIGAVPVGNIPVPGVAESLSRGVVDGALMDWGTIKSYRIYELAKFHYDFPFGAIPIMIAINENTWQKLAEPARAALERHGGMEHALASGESGDHFADEVRTEMRSEADQLIYKPTAEEAAALHKLIEEKVLANWLEGHDNRKAILEAYLNGAADAGE